MTLEEKREACLAELLAVVRQIAEHSKTLEQAQWSAMAASWSVGEISQRGRIPSLEETKQWLAQQGAVVQ